MFSKATEYALRATIYIAQKSSVENKIGIHEISKAIDSPPSFTAKIMQLLTGHHAIVRSVRGPKGGFYLTEIEKALPAQAILVAMGEDYMLSQCVLGLKKCSELSPCPMHDQYLPIKQQLISLFANKSIKQLADEMNTGDVFIKNKK